MICYRYRNLFVNGGTDGSYMYPRVARRRGYISDLSLRSSGSDIGL